MKITIEKITIEVREEWILNIVRAVIGLRAALPPSSTGPVTP